jgi:hypothetical protein
MANSYLETVRKRIFEGEDRDLYLHLGHFLAWYSKAELSLTITMAMVLGERDLAAFQQLTKGLDARTKIQRCRKNLPNQEARHRPQSRHSPYFLPQHGLSFAG